MLPPLLTKYVSSGSAQPDQGLLNLLAYQLKYDGRQRLSEKAPGVDQDWIYYVYDQWDRQVARQDGAQRVGGPKQWTFIKYDEMNRPVISGIVYNVVGRSRRHDQCSKWFPV